MVHQNLLFKIPLIKLQLFPGPIYILYPCPELFPNELMLYGVVTNNQLE
jgi:hypothetical protein